MLTILTDKINHNGKERISLMCSDIEELKSIAKKIPGCYFSGTLKCWNIPATKLAYDELMKFKDNFVISGYYNSEPKAENHFIVINKSGYVKDKINIIFLGSRQLLVKLPTLNVEWFSFFKKLQGFLWHPEFKILLIDASEKNIKLIKDEFQEQVFFRFDPNAKYVKPIITVVTSNKKPDTILLFTSDNEIIEKISYIQTARNYDFFKFFTIKNDLILINRLIDSIKSFALIDNSRYKSVESVDEVYTKQEIITSPESTEESISKIPNRQKRIREFDFSAEKKLALNKYKNYLEVRRYSERTIEVYMDCIKQFFIYFADKDFKEITNEDIRNYNKDVIIDCKYSTSYQNQSINAIKLFFRTVEQIVLVIEDIERPKRYKKLPNVLSTQEIESLLQHTRNLKHKAILTVIYSCGLRRSELLNLEVHHLNKERMVIEIIKAKGKKDRLIPVSKRLKEILDLYIQIYQPQKFMFEGITDNEKYSETALENVLRLACQRVGITKPVTLHWLRHSFGTHLLEAGTDIRIIKELMGHKNSRTTEIYTHVSTRHLRKIYSPLDSMNI